MDNIVIETELEGLNRVKQGKVRDIYDLGDRLLMVTTDRMSAFDVIMRDPIPDKGKILTQISLFWFDQMRSVIANHVITGKVDQYPAVCQPFAEILAGRSMLVKKTQPLPIECVVRGYISGSGWKSYQKDGTVCGIRLPEGLQESQQLPEAIFTPSTKEEVGQHDINIDFAAAVKLVGQKHAEQVRDLSLEIYRRGAALADEKGIIIADTKFEFGLVDDRVILIDEVLTPDSSRFWPKDTYQPDGAQQSFDKQYLRDYLSSITWDKNPPAPDLPEDIITKTRQKYLDALVILTGSRHGIQ